jgi:DNA polymerase-3 subunit epsilon
MKKDVREILVKLYETTKAPITFFDIESTGIDKITDEIIELYVCKYDGKEFIENDSYYNSNVPVREEALEKHGITNESLVGYPYFSEKAKTIYENYFSKGTILCGYCSNKFDIPFIIEKFLQAKIPSSVNILQNKRIDVYEIYRQLYPNTLEGVHSRIVGGDMGTAHEAKSDVTATIEILDKLIDTKGEYELISSSDTIDTDNFFRREDKDVFFAKGKLKDENILKMDSKESLGFLKWMTRTKSISIHSRTIANRLIEKIEKSLIDNSITF